MPADDILFADRGWIDAQTRQPVQFDADGSAAVLPVRAAVNDNFHGGEMPELIDPVVPDPGAC